MKQGTPSKLPRRSRSYPKTSHLASLAEQDPVRCCCLSTATDEEAAPTTTKKNTRRCLSGRCSLILIVFACIVKLASVNFNAMRQLEQPLFLTSRHHHESSFLSTFKNSNNGNKTISSNTNTTKSVPSSDASLTAQKEPAQNNQGQVGENVSAKAKRRGRKGQVNGKEPLQPKRTERSLALMYPVGMFGGYGNQVIRFTALVDHARINKIPQLFLPSLWFTTLVPTPTVAGNASLRGYPIPMDWVFDVEHWNKLASQPDFELPQIANPNDEDDEDVYPGCWETLDSTKTFHFVSNHSNTSQPTTVKDFLSMHHATTAAVFTWPIEYILQEYGYSAGLLNETLAMATSTITNVRRRDYLDQQNNQCERSSSKGRLVFYGGGTHGGRLWRDAMQRKKKNQVNLTHGLDAQVRLALQPNERWRRVAEQCLETRLLAASGFRNNDHGSHEENGDDDNDNKKSILQNYVALHARIELEMLAHPCGRTMVSSLEKILNMTGRFLSLHPELQDETSSKNSPRGILLVVGRDGIVGKGDYAYLLERFAKEAKSNMETLTKYVNETGHATERRLFISNGKDDDDDDDGSIGVPVFECGSFALQEHYRKPEAVNAHPPIANHGTLVESVVNFYNAVHSRIFIGVKGSSYSTDVWTTRYNMGMGASNFHYTQDNGIVPLENGGLPDSHEQCEQKKKKK